MLANVGSGNSATTTSRDCPWRAINWRAFVVLDPDEGQWIVQHSVIQLPNDLERTQWHFAGTTKIFFVHISVIYLCSAETCHVASWLFFHAFGVKLASTWLKKSQVARKLSLHHDINNINPNYGGEPTNRSYMCMNYYYKSTKSWATTTHTLVITDISSPVPVRFIYCNCITHEKIVLYRIIFQWFLVFIGWQTKCSFIGW